MHLSVIVPVYNAQQFLLRSLIALDEFISGLSCGAELIIVDDGSSDNSASIAAEWSRESRRYASQVLALGKNMGKGAAVAAGMIAAKGKYRVFLDADLTYQPSQILRVMEVLEEGADVVAACRIHPDSRYTISPSFIHYLYTRHLASRVINFILRHTIIPNCRDSQAGLKGFKADAAEAIFKRQIIQGFSFDIEALYLADKLGFSVREIAVDYHYFDEPTTVQFLQDGTGLLGAVWRIHKYFKSGGYKLNEPPSVRQR